MGASPHANGGLLTRDLELPDFRDYAAPVAAPATRDVTAQGSRVCTLVVAAREDLEIARQVEAVLQHRLSAP